MADKRSEDRDPIHKLAESEVSATDGTSADEVATEAAAADVAAAPVADDPLLAELVERFPGCGWGTSRGELVAFVPREQLLEVGAWLRDDQGFSMCVDVTAADYLDFWGRSMGTWAGERTRFEVVVNLLDLGAATPAHLLPSGVAEPNRPARRIRLRVPVPEEEPHCPSLAYTWALADCAEREAYDMFGIVFTGHPDLSRILMPDEWEGYPLRKDYAQSRIPVQFRDDTLPSPTPVSVRTKAGGPAIRYTGGSGASPTSTEAP